MKRLLLCLFLILMAPIGLSAASPAFLDDYDAEQFELADLDGDGLLSEAEVYSPEFGWERFQDPQRFYATDRDEDGYLTYEEVRVQRHYELAKAIQLNRVEAVWVANHSHVNVWLDHYPGLYLALSFHPYAVFHFSHHRHYHHWASRHPRHARHFANTLHKWRRHHRISQVRRTHHRPSHRQHFRNDRLNRRDTIRRSNRRHHVVNRQDRHLRRESINRHNRRGSINRPDNRRNVTRSRRDRGRRDRVNAPSNRNRQNVRRNRGNRSQIDKPSREAIVKRSVKVKSKKRSVAKEKPKFVRESRLGRSRAINLKPNNRIGNIGKSRAMAKRDR